jgi:hypothetical protein
MLTGAACQKKTSTENTNAQQGTAVIRTADARAFGSLAAISGTSTKTTTSSEQANDSSVGAATPTPLTDTVSLPSSTQYTFTFKGTTPTLTDANIDIYERTPSVGLTMPTDLKTTAGLGVVDLSPFSNQTLNNLSIHNGTENWYIDAQNGTVSMYNEGTTSGIEPAATTTNTSTGSAVNASADSAQVPVDTASVLRIASSFLTSHGISTAAYGTPTTVATQVVYPLLINGMPVVQQDGSPMGMTLSVDLNESTVTSLYGLTTLDFTSSAYDAVTDFSVIQKIAEQGGLYGSYGTKAVTGTPETTTTVTLELGTPDRVLMSSYLYSSGRQLELYVPALRFPITNSPEAYLKYVVVPLAKDLPTDTVPIGIRVEVPVTLQDNSETVTTQR